MSTPELKTIAANFDYSTLEFYRGENPVFINTQTGEIDTWQPGTQIEMAEKQSSVIWLGDLTEDNAKKGIKPEGGSFSKGMADRLDIVTDEKY